MLQVMAEKKKRQPSLLTLAGDQGRIDAQRKLLLETLEKEKWNLAHTAKALQMSGAPAVIRALLELAPKEYENAKKEKLVSPGNPNS